MNQFDDDDDDENPVWQMTLELKFFWKISLMHFISKWYEKYWKKIHKWILLLYNDEYFFSFSNNVDQWIKTTTTTTNEFCIKCHSFFYYLLLNVIMFINSITKHCWPLSSMLIVHFQWFSFSFSFFFDCYC